MEDQKTSASRYGRRRYAPGTPGLSGLSTRRSKLSISIAAAILIVIMVLAVASLLPAQKENTPMQVEPRAVAT